ncbi:hypothetical protein AB0M46_13830 [Dactylosporangium sp. NPDC051485]|uniref:hypothetical protein n=1 Tax=Dactylosporangium sp. NPDC051485 TaxID=3154846 RepID=UPI003449D11E
MLAAAPLGNPPVTTLGAAGWDTAVELASKLAETGAEHQAAELLAGPLSSLDPAIARPDHRVIAAAILYARCVDPMPNLVPDDVAWATYAHRAARTLHGADHPDAMRAADVLVFVLLTRDRSGEAEALRRELIQLHLDRGDVDAHLEARMGLARQLHDEGRCGDGIRQATAAWQQWIASHDPTAEGSAPMAVSLTQLLLDCGRLTEAETVIETAGLHRHAQHSQTGRAYRDVLTMRATVRRCSACTRTADRTLTAAGRST